MKDFIREFGFENLELITVDQINAYLHRLITYDKISGSQQNQRINSIKFYYERVLGRTKEYYKIEWQKKQNPAQGTLRERHNRHAFRQLVCHTEAIH